MKIGICDDDPQSRRHLKALLQQNNQHARPIQIHEFLTLQELLPQLYHVDLLFLDIEMGTENRFNAFSNTNLSQKIPIIVLISSHPSYVTQSYQLPVFQFLIKPVQPDLFASVYRDCQKQYMQAHKYCMIQTEQGSRRVFSLHKIICIKSERQKIFYYATDQTWYYSTDKSLTSVLKRLQAYNFSQVHRSYLVNQEFILQIEDSNVVLQFDGKTVMVPMGKKYLETAKQNYLHYLATKGANSFWNMP